MVTYIYAGIVGMVGIIIGQLIDFCNIRFAQEQKIFTKESFKKYIKDFKINYLLCFINAFLYVVLFYKYKLGFEFFKFSFIGSALINAFVIDYYLQIIPNRLNLTIFEVGLIFAFIAGIQNIYITFDMLLGMITGGGIFLLITLLGGIIAGKEAMGLGDVKLVGAMGLFFGLKGIILVSILSFFVGGIMCLILIAFKKKTTKDYIPFGPAIVIAAYIVMCISHSLIIGAFFYVVSLGKYKML